MSVMFELRMCGQNLFKMSGSFNQRVWQLPLSDKSAGAILIEIGQLFRPLVPLLLPFQVVHSFCLLWKQWDVC